MREDLEKAFDYRGDVTVDLKNGSFIEGFLFNRNDQKKMLQLFIKDQPTPTSIAYTEVQAIRITGEDAAAGKSWEAWKEKKEAAKSTKA